MLAFISHCLYINMNLYLQSGHFRSLNVQEQTKHIDSDVIAALRFLVADRRSDSRSLGRTSVKRPLHNLSRGLGSESHIRTTLTPSTLIQDAWRQDKPIEGVRFKRDLPCEIKLDRLMFMY